jgi:hypothetical protein
MARIPLNKFRSIYTDISTDWPPISAIYSAPSERAGIIINAHVANVTPEDVTVTMAVSSGDTFFPVVSNFPIPPFDARSLLTGRLVLEGIDAREIFEPQRLLISANGPGLVLSLGILETVNRD